MPVKMIKSLVYETIDKQVDVMEAILFTDLTAKNIRDSKPSEIIPLMKYVSKDLLLNLNRKSQFDTAKRAIMNYARKN